MRPRTMERLDLMAAESERRLLDEIRRHNATLEQIAEQRRVLAAYRERLLETWRSGVAVSAGQVQRAGSFDTASRTAESQIDLAEKRTRQQLDAALQNLAKAQAHRGGLNEMQRKAALEIERDAERRLERTQPWFRRNLDKNGGSHE